MRRRYSRADFEALLQRIAGTIPDAGLGVDVIAGFPGETDAEFEMTYSFLRDAPVSYLHVFTYSERPGTPAASLGVPVPHALRHRRNEMLRILGQKKRMAFYESMLGRIMPVLMEGDCENGLRVGLTGNYIRVGLPSEKVDQNALIPVRLEAIENGICRGVPVEAGRVR
jgi:threonylcarbamoyladenosine tRNA methylthiotransferase MtaB